ncbi:gluconolactonase [Neorhodopirellula lusitana]|uniref:Gluconolactonase n=1 Tax=Neorhodopirellula lusitana TaxID=445327 RepID=A0ABY1PTJ1_9BACT|nr:SMP-30/gluconolactonase/LRE family protein [Neorhodopirellula lusitana]SMP46149.1 gluconolactonase [Neorhodopirellula lusitana]
MRHWNLILVIALLVSCTTTPLTFAQNAPESSSRRERPVATSYPTKGRVETLDDALEQLVEKDASIEVIGTGFTWCEGPVWVPASDGTANAQVDGCDSASGCLLFSDIPRNTIFRWTPERGTEPFMQPSGYTGIHYYGLEPGSNGLTLDHQGRLCLCEHGDRRISVLESHGGKRTLVDSFQGKRLNSPNDLVLDSKGNLYFTDPPYGLPEREKDKTRELDHFGVYRLSTTGEITLLTGELTRPNGIGLSPDQKTLYVAQSDPSLPAVFKIALNDHGKTGPLVELFNASSFMKEYPGLPDGMAVHSTGTLFVSGPGGIYVIQPDGKLIGRLLTEGRTSNCTFDDKEDWLYITNDDSLCRIRMARSL